MKIIQLSKKIPYPALDGESVAIWDITLQLLKQGHEVNLICMQTNKHQLENTNKLYAHTKLWWTIVNVNTNINYINLLFSDFLSNTPYIAQRYIDNFFLDTIKKQITDFKPDIIQAESIYTANYLKYLKNTKLLKVIRSHNVENEIWKKRAKNEKNILKKLYFHFLSSKLKKFEIKTAQNADLLVNISDSDTHFFKKQLPELQTLTLPTGYTINKAKEQPQAPIFLFLGALDWFPNIEALNWLTQKVWPLLLNQIPEAQLYIAGRNPNKNDEKRWSAIKNVRFFGQIENAENFLRRGKIVLVPLKTGSGIRIKIIEAMALGIPVVATQTAVQGIPVKNKNNILYTNNATQFAQYATELHQNESLYKKIKENGLNFIQENFDSSLLINNLVKKYKKIILEKNAHNLS